MKKASSGTFFTNRTGVLGLIVFLTALLVRLIYLCQISDSPTFDNPIIDASTYHAAARRLAEDGIMNPVFFWQSFFFPFFLSRLYYYTGPSIIVARLVLLSIGATTALIVYLLALRLLERPTAFLAGLIVAFYGPLIFFDARLLATSWACFWAALLILVLSMTAEPGRRPRFFLLTGICAGSAVVTRAAFIPFIIAAAVWLAYKLFKTERGVKKASLKLTLFLIPTLAAPAFVGSLSYLENNRFSPLPESGPINLYIGNNPNSENTIAARPGRQWREITALPRRQGYSKEQSRRFFMDQFTEYVTNYPTHYLRGLGRKALCFFSSREIPRNVDIYLGTKYSSLLRILTFKIGRFGVPFGLLFPFAVVGIISGFRRLGTPLLLFLILYPVSIILVFACARYRLPLIPLLAPPAALGVRTLLKFLRTKKFARASLVIATVILIATATSLAGPFESEKNNYEAEMHYCVAFELYGDKAYLPALHHADIAVKLQPDYADAYALLGIIYTETEKPVLAADNLTKAVELGGGTPFRRYCLARNLISLSQYKQAADQLNIALENARKHNNFILSARIKNLLAEISDPNTTRH